MTIKNLYKIMSIEDDLNTIINDKRQSLLSYAINEQHQNEKVKSIYVQDNGIVIIKTKS